MPRNTIITAAVALAAAASFATTTANAVDPPWGNTLEGRVNHLETELVDTGGDVIYLSGKIRALESTDRAQQAQIVKLHRQVVRLQRRGR